MLTKQKQKPAAITAEAAAAKLQMPSDAVYLSCSVRKCSGFLLFRFMLKIVEVN